MSNILVLKLTVIVAALLRVARLILHPLALAVLSPIQGHRVGALSVGELHPAPTRPGALHPRPPQAPAAVHNHLQGGKHEQRKNARVRNNRSEVHARGSLYSAVEKPQSESFSALWPRSVLTHCN